MSGERRVSSNACCSKVTRQSSRVTPGEIAARPLTLRDRVSLALSRERESSSIHSVRTQFANGGVLVDDDA